MAYNRNISVNQGNIIVISGSQVNVTGSLIGAAISGTTAQFTVITGSHSGSGAGLFNLTASGISNFTNDVRAQFSAGTNITIVSGVISAAGGTGSGTPGGVDTNVQFNKAGTFSGSNLLTYNYTTNILSGTTAQFTAITGSGLYISGNVGIGTTTPAYKLDVNGAAAIKDYFLIEASDGVGNDSLLIFNARTNTNGNTNVARFVADAANNTTDAKFKLQMIDADGGGWDDGFTFQASPAGDDYTYTGVGTNSPTVRLDIVGNGTTAARFSSGSVIISGNLNVTGSATFTTVSGTTAQFTTISGSTVTGSSAFFNNITINTLTGSSINITGTISGSSTQSIIKSDQGISFRTRDNGTGSFTERMFISTNDTINIYSSLNTTSLTASVITANIITASVLLTGSTAQFTLISGSTVTGSTAQFTFVTASFTGSGAGLFNLTASGISNFTNDVRSQFSAGTNITINNGVISASGGSGTPGGTNQTVQFNSGSTFSGSTNLIYNYITNTLSGTTAQFTLVTASFTGSGAGLFNITASGISNFTNDVRSQFSAGTNITILGGVISSTASGGSGSANFGQVSASFSRSVHSVTSFVSDTGVSLSSNIVTTIALSSSRDLDEMELAPVVVAVGGITAGVGFNIIAVSLDGDADGTYLINYTRN